MSELKPCQFCGSPEGDCHTYGQEDHIACLYRRQVQAEAVLTEKDGIIALQKAVLQAKGARIAELEREVDVLKYGAVCVQAEPKGNSNG